ncbi:MAG: dihydrodipicolinate synthase family protein [Bacillota bacterium]
MDQMYGVVPPMITPFQEDGAVDYDGLRTLVNFLSEQVDGLFINGSYGGGVLMTEEERKAVAEATVNTAAGRVPVTVHVGTADSLSAARLVDHAVECGAAAVAAVGPYYFKHTKEDILNYFDALVTAAKGKIPVYVYNNPQFQGYPMDLDTIRQLKENVGVRGVKDATFDIQTMAKYMRVLKSDTFDVALGTEAMWLSACVLGCKAFIPGIANAFPEICRKMFREGISGDFEACRKTQFEVNEMRDIMYLARSTQMAIYAMLEIRGIVTCCPRAPFIPATEEEKSKIRTRLMALGLL